MIVLWGVGLCNPSTLLFTCMNENLPMAITNSTSSTFASTLGPTDSVPTLRFYCGEEVVTEPSHGSEGSAGWDLAVTEDILIPPNGSVMTNTHVSCVLPPGWWAFMKERSSVAAKRDTFTVAGIIDNDYRGKIRIILRAGSEGATFTKGERVAQLIPTNQPPIKVIVEKGEAPQTTERGTGGFGSTGTH